MSFKHLCRSEGKYQFDTLIRGNYNGERRELRITFFCDHKDDARLEGVKFGEAYGLTNVTVDKVVNQTRGG